MEEKYMKVALLEAKKAFAIDEVPVGACIVKDGKVIAKSYNQTRLMNNPLYHAEINVIKKAIKKLGDWRLTDCTMYVTLEPCAMCSGYILNTRLTNLVFGASESKFGCAGSIYNLLDEKKFNHRVNISSGLMKEECAKLLKDFFISKR